MRTGCKTTSRERMIIDNAMTAIMTRIEQVLELLYDAENDYFSDAEQKPIDQPDAQHIGLYIKIATYILFDACAQYGVVIGAEDWTGTKAALDQMEQDLCVFRVAELKRKVCDKERTMPEDRRHALVETRKKLDDMQDEQAEAAYKAILGG